MGKLCNTTGFSGLATGAERFVAREVGGEGVRQDTSVLAIIIDPFSISPKPSPNRNAVVGEQMRIPAADFGTLLLGKYSVGYILGTPFGPRRVRNTARHGTLRRRWSGGPGLIDAHGRTATPHA